MQYPDPKSKDENDKADESINWSADQRKRGYYYDDACGYEDYDPEADEIDDGDTPKDMPVEDIGDQEQDK